MDVREWHVSIQSKGLWTKLHFSLKLSSAPLVQIKRLSKYENKHLRNFVGEGEK
jgi:hypothetical protein